MKRLMLIGVILFTANGVLQAQTAGGQSANSTTHTSEGNNKKSKKKTALNHRRNYNWKSGQQATPTGQEATGMGSGYQSGKKDTSGKREN